MPTDATGDYFINQYGAKVYTRYNSGLTPDTAYLPADKLVPQGSTTSGGTTTTNTGGSTTTGGTTSIGWGNVNIGDGTVSLGGGDGSSGGQTVTDTGVIDPTTGNLVPYSPHADRANQRDYMRTVARQSGIPEELVELWVNAWIDTGDRDVATAKVRESTVYDTYFPGNRREDGTFRYTEAQYRQITESYADTLASHGVNPDLYEGRFGDLIAGNVSANEFASRISAINERVLNASPETMEAFANRYGIPNPAGAHVLAVALDPEVGDAVLRRELSIAEVTGASKRFGYNRGRPRVEALVNEGVTLDAARTFYSQAAQTLPTLSGAAARHNEGQFGLYQLEDAAFFGAADERSRLGRIQSRERSLFSNSVGTANNGNALTGLRPR